MEEFGRWKVWCQPRGLGLQAWFWITWTLWIGPTGWPETSVTNCHYSLRNDPEERSFQPICSGSMKSRENKSSLSYKIAKFSLLKNFLAVWRKSRRPHVWQPKLQLCGLSRFVTGSCDFEHLRTGRYGQCHYGPLSADNQHRGIAMATVIQQGLLGGKHEYPCTWHWQNCSGHWRREHFAADILWCAAGGNHWLNYLKEYLRAAFLKLFSSGDHFH
jgi:hypothetical protein